MCQPTKYRQVQLDQSLDPRPAHLHHNVSPIVQSCRMHLANRRCRQRLAAKTAEHHVGVCPELGVHRRFDCLESNGWSRVLESRKGCFQRRRHQVGPGRKNLAKLDEGRAKFGKGVPKLVGEDLAGGRPGLAAP